MGLKKGHTLKTAFDVYTVIGPRGSGGAGEVYAVRDSDGGPLAAKILRQDQSTTTRLKRFKNEVNFCRKNTHGNILRVIDTGITENGESFYVMPLYSGTLRHLISEGISPKAVLPYFGHVLDGVEAAHLQNVWHRDIKPENILFAKEDNLLVVADFGIAHFEEEDLLTAVETKNDDRLANFLYSAPEQRIRGHEVDGKADIFALGLILNEMFTGAVPQGTSFRRIADVSTEHPYLDGIVERMIRQDAASRPTVAEVKRELIARGSEFIALQRLNSIRTEVVPESEVDDPFIRNPIRLLSVDYQNERLIFGLSAAPPSNWISEFQNPRSQSSSFLGAGPQNFGFSGSLASVHVSPGMPHQQLVDYTKSYIEMANRQYAERVNSEHRKRLNQERENLRKKIADEERRQEILRNLRI
jgi:serine/threonine protein kinase